MLGRHNKIAGGYDLAPCGRGDPVDGGYDRLRHVTDRRHQLAADVEQLVVEVVGPVRHLRQIVAGAEGRWRAGNDDDAHRRIVAESTDARDEVAHDRQAERVATRRVVQ